MYCKGKKKKNSEEKEENLFIKANPLWTPYLETAGNYIQVTWSENAKFIQWFV